MGTIDCHFICLCVVSRSNDDLLRKPTAAAMQAESEGYMGLLVDQKEPSDYVKPKRPQSLDGELSYYTYAVKSYGSIAYGTIELRVSGS